jgi:hypothetical protein
LVSLTGEIGGLARGIVLRWHSVGSEEVSSLQLFKILSHLYYLFDGSRFLNSYEFGELKFDGLKVGLNLYF